MQWILRSADLGRRTAKPSSDPDDVRPMRAIYRIPAPTSCLKPVVERGNCVSGVPTPAQIREPNNMASLYKKPIVVTDPKTGKKVKSKTKKWWGRYRGDNGEEKRVPLAADKNAAQAMLNERVKKVELKAAGLCDPFEHHRKRPLTEHLDAFEHYLAHKGNSRSTSAAPQSGSANRRGLHMDLDQRHVAQRRAEIFGRFADGQGIAQHSNEQPLFTGHQAVLAVARPRSANA